MGASSSNLFYLVLSSTNPAFNGTALEPCTAGSYTALCARGGVANSSTPAFSFDQISTGSSGSPTSTGFVQYNDQDGNTTQLDFRYSPSSNVALGQLTTPRPVQPNGGLLVAFNVDSLIITDDYDDRFPTQAPNGHGNIINRWLICNHTRDALNFPTLNWQLGVQKFENPSCETVVVKRQPVSSS